MKTTKSFTFLLISFALLMNMQAQNVMYVKPNGLGNGKSWATATGDIQLAINAVETLGGGEVWVAQGNYYPSHPLITGLSSNHNTFLLKNNVKVYGGFPSTGNPTFANRNSKTNETTLSGDFSRDDWTSGTTINDFSIGFTASNEDAYHVVLSVGNTGSSLLDGFTIKNGRAAWTGANPTYNGEVVDTQMGGGGSSGKFNINNI